MAGTMLGVLMDNILNTSQLSRGNKDKSDPGLHLQGHYWQRLIGMIIHPNLRVYHATSRLLCSVVAHTIQERCGQTGNSSKAGP